MNTNDLFKSDHRDLAEIYDACYGIDLANLEIPSKEMGFLCFAVHRMARYINELGHDGSQLHSAITNYLIDLTRHADVRVALTATYALADHGVKPACVLNRLCELVTSGRRENDHPIVTMRAIALRVVKRLDLELASQYIDTVAFDDYRRTVNYWIESGSSKSTEVNSELQAEMHWLTSQEDRRTKR